MSSLAISVFFVNISVGSGLTTASATIPAVTVAKTYVQPSSVMPSPRYIGGFIVDEGDGQSGALFVKLTNATTVTITRNAVAGTSGVFLRFKGYVVEYLQPDAPTSISLDCYQLSLTLASGLLSVAATIPAVVVANTYIQPMVSNPAKLDSTTDPDVQDGQIISTFVKLTNATTVTVARDATGVRVRHFFQIIEFT